MRQVLRPVVEEAIRVVHKIQRVLILLNVSEFLSSPIVVNINHRLGISMSLEELVNNLVLSLSSKRERQTHPETQCS